MTLPHAIRESVRHLLILRGPEPAAESIAELSRELAEEIERNGGDGSSYHALAERLAPQKVSR